MHCFFDFCLDTYETHFTSKDEIADEEQPTVGRKRHTRIKYLDGSGKGKTARMLRAEDHEVHPRIVGKWFPRNNEDKSKELHSASMLLLFKPWQTLVDLKDDD